MGSRTHSVDPLIRAASRGGDLPEPSPPPCGPIAHVRQLNQGGMGAVSLVLRPGRGPCVLKTMLPETKGDQQFEARFRREAALATRLHHRAIVRTFGLRHLAGSPVIVQEFVHGRDVSQVLATANTASSRVPPALAGHVIAEVADALTYAYLHIELVHRDLAPQNVMLGFDGAVKLVDFGIAKSPVDPSTTQPGQILGRRAYLAPEVLVGGESSPVTDVYSLGTILWELLAGRPLVVAGGPGASRLPPSRYRRGISATLDRLVLRAIAWKPEDRFSDTAELAAALRRLVPPRFDGRQALKAFLATHYDVPRMREILAAELASAAELLVQATPAPVPHSRPWLAIILGLTAGAAAVLSVLASRS